jgi:GTP-binding protein YchF
MALNCGVVGLPGCGKTTIFNAITAAGAAKYDASEMNRAVVHVPDPRIDQLQNIFHAPKVVPALVQIVDIAGIAAGSTASQGRGAKLLGHIKDVDALLHVVQCFRKDTVNTVRDVETVDLEMVVADTQTVDNKIERIAKRSLGDKELAHELADCRKIKAGLDEGVPARKQKLDSHEIESVRECNLLSLKPILYIANIESVADLEHTQVKALQSYANAEGSEMIVVCGRDEAEISQLAPEERGDFLRELGLHEPSAERLIRAAYRLLGLISFFSVNEKEVHVWTCRRGDKAPVAAGHIHTDMERGFIRMEVVAIDDLIEHGSTAAAARAGKQRIEGKTYEVQDGDIVVVRFSPSK